MRYTMKLALLPPFNFCFDRMHTKRSNVLVIMTALLVSAAQTSLVAQSTSDSTLVNEQQKLLDSNKAQRIAHLENNAEMLTNELCENVCEVSGGNVRHLKRSEMLERFSQYFQAVKYYKWDDLEEPIITVSPDGMLATVIVKKITVAKMNPNSPNAEIGATQFAWTSNYRKINGEWKIFQITSTEERYESADPEFYLARGQTLFDEGKTAESLAEFTKAYYLRRENPDVAIAYAKSLTQNNRLQRAIQVLQRVAQTGLLKISEVREEPWFDSLRPLKDYARLSKAIDEVSRHDNGSTVLAEIKEPDLIPEGLAADNQTGSIYVSSLHKRKIVEITRHGEVRDFAKSMQDDLFSTVGMEVDETRRHLWVVSCSGPNMLGSESVRPWITRIHQYDVDSKSLLKVFELKSDERAFLNDLTVTKNGDVFISESLEPAIYQIKAGSSELTKFYGDSWGHQFFNGLALSSDEKTLYQAHSDGIIRIHAETGQFLGRLDHPLNMALGNIDGLAFWNGHLICHQSSLFGGVEMYQLNPSGDEVVFRTSLERNHPAFDQASTGEILGDRYVFIANAQMRSGFRDNKIKPLEELKNVLILVVPLKK